VQGRNNSICYTNNLGSTGQTKTVKAAEVEKSVTNMQQRSLIKQFESMDLVKKDQ